MMFRHITLQLTGGADRILYLILCGLQVLNEHSKVFEFNIAIVKQFNVGYRQYGAALLQFVPTWAYVALAVTVVAIGLRLWMSNT